jgi:hypothetical protein
VGVSDAPVNDLVDPCRHIYAGIDVASREPPHLDERARNDAGDAPPVRHLTAQATRYPGGTQVEQLGEGAEVVV